MIIRMVLFPEVTPRATTAVGEFGVTVISRAVACTGTGLLAGISLVDNSSDYGRADLVALDEVLLYSCDLQSCAILREETEITSFIMTEVVVISDNQALDTSLRNQHFVQKLRGRELAELTGEWDDYHVVDTLGFEQVKLLVG